MYYERVTIRLKIYQGRCPCCPYGSYASVIVPTSWLCDDILVHSEQVHTRGVRANIRCHVQIQDVLHSEGLR